MSTQGASVRDALLSEVANALCSSGARSPRLVALLQEFEQEQDVGSGATPGATYGDGVEAAARICEQCMGETARVRPVFTALGRCLVRIRALRDKPDA